jgi:hypothetical protein
LSRKIGRTIRRSKDSLQRFGRRGRHPFAIQKQFHVTTNNRQQIVKIVGDAARENANGFQLLRLPQFLFEHPLIRYVGKTPNNFNRLTFFIAQQLLIVPDPAGCPIVASNSVLH